LKKRQTERGGAVLTGKEKKKRYQKGRGGGALKKGRNRPLPLVGRRWKGILTPGWGKKLKRSSNSSEPRLQNKKKKGQRPVFGENLETQKKGGGGKNHQQKTLGHRLFNRRPQRKKKKDSKKLKLGRKWPLKQKTGKTSARRTEISGGS